MLSMLKGLIRGFVVVVLSGDELFILMTCLCVLLLLLLELTVGLARVSHARDLLLVVSLMKTLCRAIARESSEKRASERAVCSLVRSFARPLLCSLALAAIRAATDCACSRAGRRAPQAHYKRACV